MRPVPQPRQVNECCEPLTCGEHKDKILRNLERLRLEYQTISAALRNTEDAQRAYNRFHAPRAERRNFLGEFDHAKLRGGDRACALGLSVFHATMPDKNLDIIHGSGPQAQCKVYEILKGA